MSGFHLPICHNLRAEIGNYELYQYIMLSLLYPGALVSGGDERIAADSAKSA
jgi:hypothetical protein